MQYVLNQDEMDEQRGNMRALGLLPSIKDLQEFCTFVSDNLILTSGWASGRAWGCILTTDDSDYCDCCPSKKICPHPNKQWSK